MKKFIKAISTVFVLGLIISGCSSEGDDLEDGNTTECVDVDFKVIFWNQDLSGLTARIWTTGAFNSKKLTIDSANEAVFPDVRHCYQKGVHAQQLGLDPTAFVSCPK